jgi:AAA domain-containing protein
MSAPTLFRSLDSQDDPAVALVHAMSHHDAESDILSFTKEILPLSTSSNRSCARRASTRSPPPPGRARRRCLSRWQSAVATGRKDILGQEVQLGRVVTLTAENPDDLRMRFAVGLHALEIKPPDVRGRISVFDPKMSPEEMARKVATRGHVNLVIVDTLAAFFDGGDINDNVKADDFMRRFRPLTQLPGNPTVIVAAHPKKNAGPDDLKPYGAGAILNEVDGSLTLRPETTLLIFAGLEKRIAAERADKRLATFCRSARASRCKLALREGIS